LAYAGAACTAAYSIVGTVAQLHKLVIVTSIDHLSIKKSAGEHIRIRICGGAAGAAVYEPGEMATTIGTCGSIGKDIITIVLSGRKLNGSRALRKNPGH